MRERFLTPITLSPADYEALQADIVSLLRRELYAPLMRTLGKRLTLSNAHYGLIDAITLGDIHFDGAGFVGSFDASTSKALKALGAKWDKAHSRWSITVLPLDVQEALRLADKRSELLKGKLDTKLAQMSPEALAGQLHTDRLFKRTVSSVETKFQESVRSLIIAPEMSPEAKARLSEEYTNNLRLYIKDFAAEQIVKMREQVKAHTFKGNRYEDLAVHIRRSYGVAQRKAKFLARQETNLLAAKLKETRYADAGVDDYEWVCVTGTVAHPVRHMHRQLEGKRFKFSSPPVVNPQGQRKSPGEDWNCRCTAKPIVKF